MSINVKIPRRLTPGRIVSNALALVILAILVAIGIDHVAGWMGYRPSLTCGILPTLTNFCWTAALVMTFIGAALYAFTRRRSGAMLFLAGLLTGLLPLLVNGYMVRLLGLGCV